MKTAFAHWDNRIAPVFDTARRLCVVQVEDGRIVSEKDETLSEEAPVQRALRLVELGVKTLVCGAVSRPLQDMISSYGIRVISFVAGDLQDVVEAWQAGTLEQDVFAMPGCCGRARRRSGGPVYEGGFGMNRRGGMGQGGGGGRGSGRGQGSGMGLGSQTGRPMGRRCAVPGYCLCPQCGRREPHEPGVPCVKRTCPDCGTALVRE